MLESVDVGRQSIGNYEATASRPALERLRFLAEPLRGARVLHLNATPYGGGVDVDTTMRFTPIGGLVMGTRSGDLDPGVLLYLLEEKEVSPPEIGELINRQAGLLGVSGTSADMRDLLSREASDPCAAEAVALFCYQAKKFLGALAAALGGLDTLIFTGGIGEHAAPVRWRLCEGLEFLGVQLEAHRNAEHTPVISRNDGPVTVRVVPTDENLMIARHTRRLVGPR